MTHNQRSLLPYDSNYVLVHKKSVALMQVYSGILISYVSRKCDFGSEDAYSTFIDLAMMEIRKMCDQEINLIVDRLVANAFKSSTKL